MVDRPAVLVAGGDDRVDAVVSALADRSLPAAVVAPRTVGERLAERQPDCVVCLGSEALSPLATLAAVREHGPAVRAVVVDPDVDVTSRATRVLEGATPGAVAGVVDELVHLSPAERERDGGDLLETGPRGEQLRRLLRATRELLAADEVDDVCEVSVEAARDVLGLPAAGIHLAGSDATGSGPGPTRGGTERLPPVAASEGARELFGGEPPTYTPDDALVWDVFDSGEPAAIDDLRERDPDSPARSVLLLPLGTHGVFISSSPRPGAFDDVEAGLAMLLAANTEAALDDIEHRAALRARETELRAERDRLSALFENVPVPAVHIDHRDGEPVVLDVNRAFEDVFGFDAGTLVGENIDDYVMPEGDQDVAPSVAEEAASGGAIARQVRRRTADGLREFLLTIAPVEPGADDGLAYGFYIDITERQQREQRLRVLSRVLRHDLRNHVTIIRGAGEDVADRTTDDAVERAAEDVVSAADELATIGRKTRIVERALVDAGNGEVSTVRRIVGGAVAPFRNGSHGARVTVAVPGDAEVASAEAVALALRELVENAVVHCGADRPRVWVHGRTTGDGFLELDLVDDGPGIPDEERAVLTGESEPTQLEHASGLGLWVARWIVGALGGEFAIGERRSGGTVVELRLPLAGSGPT